MKSVGAQFVELAILAIAVACVTWTVTHEEVFREPREWCIRRSKVCRTLYARKFYYLFTCEYCFSHYVAALFVWITGYRLLFEDWRGYAIAVFTLVWIANLYMSAYGRLRLDLRRERIELENVEHPEGHPRTTQNNHEPAGRNETEEESQHCAGVGDRFTIPSGR